MSDRSDSEIERTMEETRIRMWALLLDHRWAHYQPTTLETQTWLRRLRTMAARVRRRGKYRARKGTQVATRDAQLVRCNGTWHMLQRTYADIDAHMTVKEGDTFNANDAIAISCPELFKPKDA